MRIKESDLDIMVRRLNRMAGFGDNPSYSTIGAYIIDHAYGGVSLHKYANESGAVHDVFRCGHIPKKGLYYRICAYIDGIEEGRK